MNDTLSATTEVSRDVHGSQAASPWPSVIVNGDLNRARLEWLHTNGAGAYASSTLACMHQRRYHGLLVAALDAPRVRTVYLSHVDAIVTVPRTAPGEGADASMGTRSARLDGIGTRARAGAAHRWDLSKHQFPGVDPEATPFYLLRFDQDPLPRFTYGVAGGELRAHRSARPR